MNYGSYYNRDPYILKRGCCYYFKKKVVNTDNQPKTH